MPDNHGNYKEITLIYKANCLSQQSQAGSFTAYFNPFPHDKILEQTKLKAFADDKSNVNNNKNNHFFLSLIV